MTDPFATVMGTKHGRVVKPTLLLRFKLTNPRYLAPELKGDYSIIEIGSFSEAFQRIKAEMDMRCPIADGGILLSFGRPYLEMKEFEDGKLVNSIKGELAIWDYCAERYLADAAEDLRRRGLDKRSKKEFLRAMGVLND